MKVEVKKIDKLKRCMDVSVDGGQFLKEREAFYQKIGRKLKVPGFRAGNAPLAILKKHHAKTLAEEFLRKTLPVYYRNALAEKGITAVGQPRIEAVNLTEESLTFSAEFDVPPDLAVKDTDYKGLRIKDRKIEVNEEEAEKVIAHTKEEIKKVVNRDLEDEELAKWAGYPNPARLREAVRGEIFLEKLRERRREIERQVSEQLLKNISFDLPKGEVESYHKNLLEQEIQNLRLRGVKEEEINRHKKEIEEKLKSFAREQIKLSYITKAVAEQEKIKGEDNLGKIVLGFILSQAEYL